MEDNSDTCCNRLKGILLTEQHGACVFEKRVIVSEGYFSLQIRSHVRVYQILRTQKSRPKSGFKARQWEYQRSLKLFPFHPKIRKKEMSMQAGGEQPQKHEMGLSFCKKDQPYETQ